MTLLLLLSLAVLAGGSGAVLELTSIAAFDSLVARLDADANTTAMIAFTAPWCSHCVALKPEWDAAATKMKNSGVTWARVDATRLRSLAALFSVRGYPSLVHLHGRDARHVAVPEHSRTALVAYAALAWRSFPPMPPAEGPWGVWPRVYSLGLRSLEALALTLAPLIHFVTRSNSGDAVGDGGDDSDGGLPLAVAQGIAVCAAITALVACLIGTAVCSGKKSRKGGPKRAKTR